MKLAARVKLALDYTDEIGEALGIIAPEGEEERPEDMKPKPTLDGFSAGHPVIRCPRGKAEQVELEADRADGKGWVLVAMARRSKTTDMFALPPAGTAQVWRYRAIFRDATQRIGQWSDVISVSVPGREISARRLRALRPGNARPRIRSSEAARGS